MLLAPERSISVQKDVREKRAPMAIRDFDSAHCHVDGAHVEERQTRIHDLAGQRRYGEIRLLRLLADEVVADHAALRRSTRGPRCVDQKGEIAWSSCYGDRPSLGTAMLVEWTHLDLRGFHILRVTTHQDELDCVDFIQHGDDVREIDVFTYDDACLGVFELMP
jgi:hypothetical protein